MVSRSKGSLLIGAVGRRFYIPRAQAGVGRRRVRTLRTIVFGAGNLLRRTANASRDKIALRSRTASGKPVPLLWSIPFQNNFKRKPSDKAVTPGPRSKPMKCCAKDFIRTLGLSGLIIAA